VRQTAEALAVACDMGIVHRDLKPDNIMIAKTRDGADLVKVVDFGIAKAAGVDSQKVTKTGLVVGTPDYMSPEQLSGDKLDGRSDIYSLGLVAFNMLTGQLPFPSDSAQESMIMRLTDKPKALVDMRPNVEWPADVQAVMDKALERDVSLRYQTATEFGLALHQAVDRMPTSVAAEAGTQVMDAPVAPVPATRIAPAVTAPEPVTQAAAPAARSRMVPIVGGVVAVLAVAFAVLYKMTDRPMTSAQLAADTMMKSKVVLSPPAADPAADFNRIEELAKDSVTATTALLQIAGIHASNDESTVRVAYVRYLAKRNLGQADACTELKAVRNIAPKTSKASVIKSNLAEVCTD
jgi:hypothetical protein